MLLVVLVTLVLIVLRLMGDTSLALQIVSHLFTGVLLGYTIGTTNWVCISCLVLLGITEVYVLVRKFIPSIGVATLIKKL